MSKTPAVALLLVASVLTFLFCVVSTFVFSAALDTYTVAGDAAPTTMLLGLGALVILPVAAVHATIGGWRTMIGERYARAALWALAPLVLMGLDGLILQLTGLW